MVNVQVTVVSGFPIRSRTAVAPPVIVTVYLVFAARLVVGSRIHLLVVPLRATVATTGAPLGLMRAKVVPLTPWTGSLKVAVMMAARLTPVAPDAGVRDDTVGAGPVLNCHVVVASGLPARSRMAVLPPVSVAVYTVSSTRVEAGLRIHLFVVLLRDTTAGTTVPFVPVSVKVFASTPRTASLKVAVTFADSPTLVAPSAGTGLVTVGAVLSPLPVVVKLQLRVANGWSALSRIAVEPPVMVAVYVLPAARLTGRKVAVRLVES